MERVPGHGLTLTLRLLTLPHNEWRGCLVMPNPPLCQNGWSSNTKAKHECDPNYMPVFTVASGHRSRRKSKYASNLDTDVNQNDAYDPSAGDATSDPYDGHAISSPYDGDAISSPYDGDATSYPYPNVNDTACGSKTHKPSGTGAASRGI